LGEVTCRKCGFTVSFDPANGVLNLQYDHDAWRLQCLHPEASSLGTCPAVLDQLSAAMKAVAKNGSNGSNGNSEG